MHREARSHHIDRQGRAVRARVVSPTYRYARRHGDRFGVPAPVYTAEDLERFALYADDYWDEQQAGEEDGADFARLDPAHRTRTDLASAYAHAGMWVNRVRELLAGLTSQDAADRARDALEGAGHLGQPFRCLVDGARRAQPRAAAAVELARAARIVAVAIRVAGLGLPSQLDGTPTDSSLLAILALLSFAADSAGLHSEPKVPRIRARHLASLALAPRLLGQRPQFARG